MAKKASSIENRVYLFDTLAEALLSGAGGELLTSNKAADRDRALRALADLAFVSCVVADTGRVDAEGVRKQLLADLQARPRVSATGPATVPPVPKAAAARPDKGKPSRKRRKTRPKSSQSSKS